MVEVHWCQGSSYNRRFTSLRGLASLTLRPPLTPSTRVHNQHHSPSSIKGNKLQEFTRNSGRDLALDEFYHIQWESADCHDDGHLPSKAHGDNKRQVCRESCVQSRPSLEGE